MLAKFQKKKKAGIKDARAFSFPPPPAEIKWAHEGDFKIMAFLKQAKHSALQPGYVMSQQWVTCYDLIPSLL